MKRCQQRQPLFLVALVPRGRSHIRVIPRSPTLVRRHVAAPSITIVIGRCAYIPGERPLLAQSGHSPPTTRSESANRVVLIARRSLPIYPDERTSKDRAGMSQKCHCTKSLRSSPLRGGQEPRDRKPAERTTLAHLRAPS